MSIEFIDRVPTKAGRVKLTLDDGSSYYATLERADEPVETGTPLNAATFNRLVEEINGKSPEDHAHSGLKIYPSSIELTPPTGTSNGGFIDFHFGGSEEDYTSRIIESVAGRLSISGGLTLGSPLATAYGGTGVNSYADLVSLIFGTSYESWQSVTSYPKKPGIYRTVGTNIFSNLTGVGMYGVLVIFKAAYAIHLYVDESGRMAYGRSGETFGEPSTWLFVDSIQERGTSGIWTYRKYANGVAECWGRQSYSGTADYAWGSLYAMVCDAPNYPFTFSELPCVVRSVQGAGGNSCWLSNWQAESAANSGKFALVRPTNTAISNASVCFYAIGKWK